MVLITIRTTTLITKFLFVLFCFCSSSLAVGSPPASIVEVTARNILKRHCVSCHGELKVSGLDLRQLETTLIGGSQGPSLVPGKATESLLFLAAAHVGELKMPPGKPALSLQDLEVLRNWINAGAPWASVVASHKESEPTWWSLRSPRRPLIPPVREDTQIRNPIDAFILEKLGEKQLKPAPDTDKRTLIRRAAFDLTGLPPKPEQVEKFLNDPSPDAYEKLLDSFMGSPRYGERWGRHWLDVVRYADSGGYETDEYFPNAWRYRDYVIKSFNENKPYDRFLQEQIAGDELWPDNLDLNKDYYGIAPEKLEHMEAKVGTGLYTFGPEILEDLLDAPKLVNSRLTDWADTTGTVFMGLTVGCARCHTHKFDPISQEDYYRFQAFFAASQPVEIPVVTKMGIFHRNESYPIMLGIDEARRSYRLYLSQLKEKLVDLTKSEFSPKILQAYEITEEKRTPQEKKLALPLILALKSLDENWEDQLTLEEKEEKRKKLQKIGEAVLELPEKDHSHAVTYDGFYDVPKASVLGHREPDLIPRVHVLDRGELDRKGEEVDASVPAIFHYLGNSENESSHVDGAKVHHTRKQLALWLTRPDHPLTARVMVNRLWQWHFGHGIVRTPNDFGVRGDPPTHPELLDWLATEFVSSGWDIKAMHKLIMLSNTYRMTSRYSNLRNIEMDPENHFLWRMNRRRLEAETVWDTLHAVAGTINLKMGGRPVVPSLLEDELAGLPALFLWPVSADPDEHRRRGVYILSRRSFPFPMFRIFDQPDSSISCPSRDETTVATQSLWSLNNKIVLEQATELAKRLVNIDGESASTWVSNLWEITLGRFPSKDEKREALELMKIIENHGELANGWEKMPPVLEEIGPARSSSLIALCLTMFNLNEFLYID